jgi:ATP-dependent Clp protease adaptor protein ClpS
MIAVPSDYWGPDKKPREDWIMDESQAAVAEPIAETRKRQADRQKKKPKRQPRYHVILWNDEDHTYEYVITMMKVLFGFPQEKGYEIAKTVDTQGRAVVTTTTKEHAELKRDQIHAYGKDAIMDGCKGSMWATIEPEV